VKTERYTWDDTFMSMAIEMSMRSADPSTQVGCILVDKRNRIIGAGYNGPPRGICPSSIPWKREGAPEDIKYSYVLHSEQNALENSTASTEGAKAYITLQPCNICGMSLIQAGIKEVIYLSDKYKDVWFTKVALDMFERVDVTVRKHKWSDDYIKIQRGK
jgi:dCMP deaminase